MPPQNPMSIVGFTKADFVKRYWFTPLQMVKVRNIDWHINRDTGLRSSQDFIFVSEGRHFMVRANGEEEYVGPIANAYLKGMTSFLAQADNRFESLADFTFVAEYYNKLIVDVRDLAPEYNPMSDAQLRAQQVTAQLPPWMQNQQSPVAQQPAAAQITAPMPPWEQPATTSSVPLSQPTAALANPPQPAVLQSAPVTPAPQVAKGFRLSDKSKEGTKQFELNGLTFKSVVGTDGQIAYYKNDIEIDVASFSKAASML